MGIPIIVAGQVTGIDPFLIGAMAGRQLPLLSLLVPFWLVFMMDGFRGVREVWPAALVTGLSFAVTQYFTSNHIGPELPDITSALVSLVSRTLFLKVWQPKNAKVARAVGGARRHGCAPSFSGFGGGGLLRRPRRVATAPPFPYTWPQDHRLGAIRRDGMSPCGACPFLKALLAWRALSSLAQAHAYR